MPVSKRRSEQGLTDIPTTDTPVLMPVPMLTPVQEVGNIWLKRDDLWQGAPPAKGGKARTADAVCRRAVQEGLTEICAAIDRNSSVPGMLSRVCWHYRLGLRLWIPASKDPLPLPLAEAQENGAALVEIRPGYMSVRRKRLREYVASTEGTVEIGLGLIWGKCGQYETFIQTRNVMELVEAGEVRRVVVPVGSGGMLRGMVPGLPRVPIFGVCCGGIPDDRFPPNVTLVQSRHGFHKSVKASIGDTVLDPVYEAKCFEYLREGDLLWLVGHRDSQ